MVGVRKFRNKVEPVYFGHPSTFWQGRRGTEQELFSQVGAQKKVNAVVNHAAVVQKRQLHRLAEIRVQEKLRRSDEETARKRERLRQLLENDREAYIQEMATLQALEECKVCEERNTKLERYLEELETEKKMECERALEHEKIAYGMKIGKKEEMELQHMQWLQMKEKQYIEAAEKERENMWHHVLMDDWRKKEEQARREHEKREEQMRETRRLYDEQIASAGRARTLAVRVAKEYENKRLEAVKRGLEKEREEGIRRKKEKQNALEQYFAEDRRIRTENKMQETLAERMLDNAHIRQNQEELNRDKQKERETMRRLQAEKKVFLDNFTTERRLAAAMEEERDRTTTTWTEQSLKRADELCSEKDEARIKHKQALAEDYRQFQRATLQALSEKRRERDVTAMSVRRTALDNVRRNLSEAEKEIKLQEDYRDEIEKQIQRSQLVLKQEKNIADKRQEPFTRKSSDFRNAVITKIGVSPGRQSTLPVHPFARVFLAPLTKAEEKNSKQQ